MAADNALFGPIREISFQKNTFQTRLISWRAAFKDFSSHPAFGTGYGNYAITFDKYFDPIFYSYTASETFFDRAHNNIIDILSTTGTLGLLTYLSIFVFVLVYLIKGYRSGKIKIADFIIVFSLITAYFVQNLAVFDSLVTYISLMVLLGYVYWLYQNNENEEDESVESDKGLDNKEIFSFVIIGVIALFIIYQYNVKPIRMLQGTIAGQMEINKGNTEGMYEVYQDALSIGTPLDRDSRTSLIRAIVSKPSLLSNVSATRATEILEYIIEQSEINLEYNQSDCLNLLLHAQLLDLAAKFNRSNASKFAFYSDQSLEIINRAIESSSGRVNIYYFLAQIYITRNQSGEAIEVMRHAVSLNPSYIMSTCQLAKTLFSFGEEEDGYKEMGKCLDKGGIGQINTKSLAVNLLNHYTELGDNEKVLLLYQSLTRIAGGDTQVWISMAQFYKEMGDNENAIKSAQKAVEIDPSLQGSVDAFVNGFQ
jgi:tetratricopeptide (TPR) repeat protein